MGFSSFKSYGSKVAIPNNVLAVVQKTAYQQLIIDKKPWGRYSAESWSGTTLPELGGNTSRNATTSGVVKGTSSGNGANASIAYLNGDRTNVIEWTTGSIPTIFTICSITRYLTTADNNSIVLGGLNFENDYWIGGHYGNRRGQAFFGGFKIPYGGQPTKPYPTNRQDWLVFCSTNSTTVSSPANILLDGIASATANGGYGNNADRMRINRTDTVGNIEPSDFGFSQLLIFDQALTANEMVIVSKALQNYLATGVLDTPSN
jgi:hypothetical protein